MRKDIYQLGLHEWTHCESDDGALPFNTVMRVSGGWIYCQWDNSKQEFLSGSLFIPYNCEFKELGENKHPKIAPFPGTQHFKED